MSGEHITLPEAAEIAGADMRGSAASSTSETYDLPDSFMDVSQVADYLRASKTAACKLIELKNIPTIGIGRLLHVRNGELDETLRAMGSRMDGGKIEENMRVRKSMSTAEQLVEQLKSRGFTFEKVLKQAGSMKKNEG